MGHLHCTYLIMRQLTQITKRFSNVEGWMCILRKERHIPHTNKQREAEETNLFHNLEPKWTLHKARSQRSHR